jgi:phage terminase large subunit GpA-like protein
MGEPLPGRWAWDHHPWLYGIHACDSEIMVGMKSAQMGYTETALNKTFYKIDVGGTSVLYVLPASSPDASDFSSSRFDPALELSPHLSTLFSNVKNIGHKRAGAANLFIRGSRSRSQMKSLPVGFMVFDEVDEMNQDNIVLAFERVAGQRIFQIFLISTPTISNYGIHEHYQISTQEHYLFRCPHCNRYTEFIYPECLVICGESLTDPALTQTHVRCKECKIKLDHEAKIEFLKNREAGGTGHWHPTHTDRMSRGFYINQMYSIMRKPYELAISYLRAQTNPADEQEFFNSKLGLTHAVEGAKVSHADLAKCQGDYAMRNISPSHKFCTMGIDVGKQLHLEISSWIFDKGKYTYDVSESAQQRIIKIETCKTFEELVQIALRHYVRAIIIDAQPERREVQRFCNFFKGIAHGCFYGRGISGRMVRVNDVDYTVTVDRTAWMDTALSRFRNQTTSIPIDTPMVYKQHIMAPTRVFQKDADGNPVARYQTGKEDDHYAHAHTYNEIALMMAAGAQKSETIKDEY